MVTEHDAKKAGAEVVKQVDSPFQSGLLYPCLQALDEEYLSVDTQFGGVDQRKIFTFAEKYLPKLGYKKRSHLMNPMVPGLTGGKMSASLKDSKIDLLDSDKCVEEKIMNAVCDPSQPENGVLAFIKYVIFPVLSLKNRNFIIADKEYNNYDSLLADFISGDVSTKDIKITFIYELQDLLRLLRNELDTKDFQFITQNAYHSPKLDELSSTINSVNITCGDEYIHKNVKFENLPKQLEDGKYGKPGTLLFNVYITKKPSVSLIGQVAYIRKFVQAGFSVIVQICDYASHLDACQVPFEILGKRTAYYICLMKVLFDVQHVCTDNVTFIEASEMQSTKDYCLDLFKLSALITCKESSDVVSSIVKDPSLLSSHLYADMFAVDLKHRRAQISLVDEQFAPLCSYSNKNQTLINGELSVFVCTKNVPVLHQKTTLLTEDGYLEAHEDPSKLKKKISSAFCEVGNVEYNPVISLLESVIFPHMDVLKMDISFKVANGNLITRNFDEVRDAFREGRLHPGDLKTVVTSLLSDLIKDIELKGESLGLRSLYKNSFPIEKKQKIGPVSEEFLPHKFNMIVGKIVDVVYHPQADTLYLQKIDVGEEEPRTIVSGLVKYVPIDEMKQRLVVVLANLKPQKMRGELSSGMVLCASTPDAVEPISPAVGSSPGDRVIVENYEGQADPLLNTKKSDALSKMLSGFKINPSLCANWCGNILSTAAGPVTVHSLKGAPIK